MRFSEWLHWIAITGAGAVIYFLIEWGYLTLWQGAGIFAAIAMAGFFFDWWRKPREQREPSDKSSDTASSSGDSSQTLAGSGSSQSKSESSGNQLTFAPVINVGNVGLPNESASSSHVARAAVKDTETRLEQIKAANAPPAISVEADAGKEVTVTLHNAGGAFKLKTRIKLITASKQIDDSRFHEYFERSVHGGSGISQFRIATTLDSYSVWIEGEYQDHIQKWQISAFQPQVTFKVVMVFLMVIKDELRSLGEWSISCEYDAKKKRFTKAIATPSIAGTASLPSE